jgi:transcriptional regulator with XRE-family HTH domain
VPKLNFEINYHKRFTHTMNLRKLLGITQEEAAMLLGISKAQISMYEVGQRDLPTHALVKLATLSNHVSDAMNKRKDAGTDKKALQKVSVTIIEEMLAKHELKKKLLERKLKTMIANEQKAFAAMQVAIYEQKNNKEARKNELDHLLSQAEKKLARNNWQEQLACQYEIVALEGMITTLKAHKDKLY